MVELTNIDGIRVGVDAWGSFHAEPEEGTSLRSDTLEGLKEEIGKYLKAQVAAARDKMALAVILPDGIRATVTGIHLGSHALLGLERRSQTHCYPLTSGLVPRIQEVIDLEDKLREAQKLIEPYAIRTSWGYGRIAPEEAVSKTRELREEYEQKRKAAEVAFQ